MRKQLKDSISPFSELIDELQKISYEDLAPKEEIKKYKEVLKLFQELADGVRKGETMVNREWEPATVLEELGKVVSILKNITEKQEQRTAVVPKTKPPEKGHDAFSVLQGLARMPDNPFVSDHIKAQLQAGKNWDKKGAWQKNTQGAMALRTEHKKGGTSTALIRALDEADTMNEQLQQQVLERLGAFTVDVSLAISAGFCDPRNAQYPLRSPITVTTENIRAYKKFKGYGLEIIEMDRRIEQAIKDLSRLRIEFDRVKVDGREAVTIRDGKLFDIEEYIREQQLIDGTWIVLEKGWKVRPGMWENAFLSPTQRLWFSHTAREVLELSHRDNRPVEQMAKAFWVTLFICPAGTWHLEEPKEIQIEALLENNGFLVQPEHRGKDWYWKLRKNVEAALDKLLQMGAAIEWHYLPGCPPVSDQSPGAAQNWLDAKISITDPAAIPTMERERLMVPEDDKHPYNRALKRAAIEDQAREIREARKVKSYRRKPKAQAPLPIPEPIGTITPAALKQWRNERAIQQGEMARQLGVTQQYYSLMEREKRPITAELTKKLQALMDDTERD